MKRRILFVDDELSVLQALQRALRSHRDEWEMEFTVSAEDALIMMQSSHFDAVVTDIRMPGVDGVQFLMEVMNQYPHTLRFVLSGQAANDAIVKTVLPAHQFITKPCEAETVLGIVARALETRDRFLDPGLKKILPYLRVVPTLPTLYLQVIAATRDPNSSLKRIGELISQDLSLSAEVLKLVNSAFFGLRRYVSDPVEAVALLGLDAIRSLMLLFGAFSQLGDHQPSRLCISPKSLRNHSLGVASRASAAARVLDMKRAETDEVFVAGLFHDLGRLVLAVNLPEEYRIAYLTAVKRRIPLIQSEQAIFGTTHAFVGACILGAWGFSDAIVEACAFHHFPDRCRPEFAPWVMAVHIADALVHRANPDGHSSLYGDLDQQMVAKHNMEEVVASYQDSNAYPI